LIDLFTIGGKNMTKLLKVSLMIAIAVVLVLGLQVNPTPAKPLVLKYASMNPPTA
jgi:hypothetical protein